MQGSRPLSLRERQRRETHAAIQQAAIGLVLERGVAAVTVQDISDAAEVSPRTFFNHFRSKEEVLVPDFAGFAESAEATFLSGHEPDLLNALARLMTEHIQDKAHARGVGRQDFLRQLHLVAANPCLAPRLLVVFDALRQRLAELVAQRTGRTPDDLFCRVAAAVTVGTTRVTLQGWADQDDATSPDDPLSLDEGFAALRALMTERTTKETP